MQFINFGRPLSNKEIEYIKHDIDKTREAVERWKKANPRIMIAPKILYICDRRACERCDPECHLTHKIEHATFFRKEHDTFVEQEENT